MGNATQICQEAGDRLWITLLDIHGRRGKVLNLVQHKDHTDTLRL
ncbi:hypothetical protein MICRO11B_290068 [Micrococcus luteus]|nr:hypothetical protein MICRO11B_290068 [Micrococcus luteus]